MELRSSQCKKCVINALTFLEFVIKVPSIKFLVVESRDTGFHLDQFICLRGYGIGNLLHGKR